MIRRKILITGASSGLGAGMARAFAAKGRDVALCARRLDRLEDLKAELHQRYPNVTVAVATRDVTEHDQVPVVFTQLAEELGGLDRVIVNAGIGKGAPLGSGKLWANKATLETNLVAALVQIEAALERKQGANVWLTFAIREGKNREVRNVLAHLIDLDARNILKFEGIPGPNTRIAAP